MSDPLSVAAAIAGIATTGFAIAKAIRQIASAVGNAGREIRDYGQEIDAFARLLDLVHAEILGSLDCQFGPAIFEQVKYICSGVLEPFHRLQKLLIPMIARFQSNTSWFDQFCTKVQWVFEKKREMLFYRENLKIRHRILDTALLVLISHNSRDARAQTIHVIETSIDRSLKELQVIADESATTVQALGIDWQQIDLSQDIKNDHSMLENDPANSDHQLNTNQTKNDAANPEETLLKTPNQPEAHPDTVEDSAEPKQSCMELVLRKKESDPDIDETKTISDEELDQAIDSCLDPDGGSSMRKTQFVTAKASKKILEISTEVFNNRRAESEAKDRPGSTSSESPSDRKYMIAIVCAFSFELAAMKSMLNKWSRTDPKCSTYVTGTIGTHSVVIYCLPHPGYGNPLNFETYNRIYADFPSVLFTISLGIAGASATISNDIHLGDVVVGRPNVRGDSMLQIQNYNSLVTSSTKAIPRRSYQLPDLLQSAIESLRAEYDMKKPNFHKHIPVALGIISASKSGFYKRESLPDKLFKAECHHKDSSDCSGCREEYEIKRPERSNLVDPEVHYGVIASCTIPIDSASDRDYFANKAPNVLCFEAEGGEISSVLPCLVVRGVSDYADSHKSEIWQRPAALAAAAYIRDLILWLPKIKQT